MKEKVYFDDSKGNKVCGILNDPLDDKNIPMVILCHGFSSTKDSPSYDIFQNAFNKRNISIFKIDFYGHGESDGEFADITLSLGVDDALSAIKYLKKQGYTKICLVGTSFGGAVGLIAATKCKDLFCLALKCPVSDYYGSYLTKKTPEQLRTWQEKGYLNYIKRTGESMRLNYSFFEDLHNYENYYKNYENITIPTLIVHGDKDLSVPLEESKRTASLIPNCKLEIIAGADHYLTRPGEAEKIAEMIAEFVKEN